MGLFKAAIILLVGIVSINIIDSGALKLNNVPLFGKNMNAYIEKNNQIVWLTVT